MSSLSRALEDLRQGKMIILVDDEDRENEGDLVLAAEFVTAEAVNFMAKHARGLICLTLENGRIEELQLPMMTAMNRSPRGTAFTISIEAKHGVTTGISAADRARTIQVAMDPKSGPQSLVSPGHVFPLRAQTGGVLVRAGHTTGLTRGLLVGLSVASVVLAWSVVHTVFTLRYANLYYTGRPGGVDFNEQEAPDYIDFVYLALTIGMTFQVSDTDLKTKDIRRTAVRHALLSYMFGAIILAATVNLIAGLSK